MPKKELTKQERIKKEINKLNRIFKNCSNQDILTRLIKRAAMLLIISEDMEEEILNFDKYTVETINASQQFLKANPLLKDYRDTVKSYQTVIKQLCDLTKNELGSFEKDELEDFISK